MSRPFPFPAPSVAFQPPSSVHISGLPASQSAAHTAQMALLFSACGPVFDFHSKPSSGSLVIRFVTAQHAVAAVAEWTQWLASASASSASPASDEPNRHASPAGPPPAGQGSTGAPATCPASAFSFSTPTRATQTYQLASSPPSAGSIIASLAMTSPASSLTGPARPPLWSHLSAGQQWSSPDAAARPGPLFAALADAVVDPSQRLQHHAATAQPSGGGSYTTSSGHDGCAPMDTTASAQHAAQLDAYQACQQAVLFDSPITASHSQGPTWLPLSPAARPTYTALPPAVSAQQPAAYGHPSHLVHPDSAPGSVPEPLCSVSWEVIDEKHEPRADDVRDLEHFVSTVARRLQWEGGIKVYHSYTVCRAKVDSQEKFVAAVRGNMMLSVWKSTRERPSPPLSIITDEAVLATQRYCVAASTIVPYMAPPASSPTTSVRDFGSASSASPSQHLSTPMSSSPQSGESPRSGSNLGSMSRAVRKRDGAKCVFLNTEPPIGLGHNCHILAAHPSRRLLDGEWYALHRQRLIDRNLDQYIMTVTAYVQHKASLGLQWANQPASHQTHVLTLPCDAREESDVMYSARLGLFGHQPFNHALEHGLVKLEMHAADDGRRDPSFTVAWSMTAQHQQKLFGDWVIRLGDDEQRRPGGGALPRGGTLRVPATVDGRCTWPQKLVFELYCEVWYPFQTWKAQKEPATPAERAGHLLGKDQKAD